jgi:hypothetical protein
MAIFRSTAHIFAQGVGGVGEIFDNNWSNYNFIKTPPKKNWDYARQLQIEDVNVWEVIYEESGRLEVYASWDPYAEFYMVVHKKSVVDTYYGAGSQDIIKKILDENGGTYALHKKWVDPDDMWIYDTTDKKNVLQAALLLKQTIQH